MNTAILNLLLGIIFGIVFTLFFQKKLLPIIRKRFGKKIVHKAEQTIANQTALLPPGFENLIGGVMQQMGLSPQQIQSVKDKKPEISSQKPKVKRKSFLQPKYPSEEEKRIAEDNIKPIEEVMKKNASEKKIEEVMKKNEVSDTENSD